MYRIGEKIITIVVILILVGSGLTVMLGQGSGNALDNKDETTSEPIEKVKSEGEEVEERKKGKVGKSESTKPMMDNSADWRSKLTEPISKRLDSSIEKTTVQVATQDVGNLNRLLKQVGGTPHLSVEEASSEDFDYSYLDYETGTGDVIYRNIDIPTEALDDLGKLKGVQKVARKPERTLDSNSEPRSGAEKTKIDVSSTIEERGMKDIKTEGFTEQSIQSNEPEGEVRKTSSTDITNPMTRSHNGPEAWDQGYQGDGMNIGIVDTGTDFSQADLVNQWATADDGDYSGWPLMFSPGAMEYYLAYDYPNDNFSGASSGYSQTNFTITETGDWLDVNISKNDFDTKKTYNISDLEYDSVSNHYKFGVCKAPHLTDLWGERVGMLLVDSQTAHEYDTVYVDIDNDLNFSDEKPVNKSSPLAFTEIKSYSGSTSQSDLRNIDNYEFEYLGHSADEADIGLSAGLLYWIADGEHSLPYADRYAEMMGYDAPPVPGDGNLTAFYHDWGYHGTATASNAAGTGRSGEINSNEVPGIGLDNFTAKSIAPKAKVMGVDALGSPLGGSIQAGWFFLSEGYDGEADTGDEADINSNSWGVTSAHNSGWSYYDRLAMSMNKQYPNTTIVASAGNEGNGYGSIHPPGSSPGVISVGAGVNYGYRNGIAGAGSQVDQEPSGDIIGFSSRGPNSMGQPGVDVYATGEYAWAAFPVSYAWTYTDAFGSKHIGWQQWESISNSLGTPYPHNNTHDIMRFSGTSCSAPVTAGAAALAYQAYQDNHGGVPPSNDNLKNIMMASSDDNGYNPTQQGAGWINASMAVKLASESEGAVADQDFWSPGDYDGTSHRGMANLMHPGESDTLDLNIDTFGSTSVTDVSASRYTKTTEYTFSFDNVTYDRIANITTDGIYNATGVKMVDDPKLDTILNNEDGFIKVVGNLNTRGPYYGYAYAQFFNWNDTSGTQNGVYDGPNERIRMTRALQADGYYFSANIHNPKERVSDGLVMQSGLDYGSWYYTFSGDITLQAYENTSTSWTSVSGSGPDYTVNLTVPDDARTGGYEGAVTYTTSSGQTGIVPVFVNVANSSWPVRDIGGETPQTSLYSNNRIGAHSDYYDNRYFYIDHDHSLDVIQDRNFVGFLRNLSGNSSLTMNVYGVSYSQYSGGEFGDFTMEKVTSSVSTNDPTKLMIEMTEYIQSNPSEPLMLEVRCTRVGKVDQPYGETINGSLGHNDMSPLTFTEYNEPTGQHEIGVETNIDIPGGLSAIAPERVNESVDDAPIDPHPYNHDNFVAYLADAPNDENFTLSGAYTFSFEIWGNADSDDYDLGVFLDGKNGNPEDGEAQEGEIVDYSADLSANEKVELVGPADGTYICKMAGYTVDSGLVDWEMERYVPGYSPFDTTNVPTTTITPGSDYDISSPDASFQTTWDIAPENQTGTVTGRIYASPIFSPTALMQRIDPIVIFDYQKPNISDNSPNSAERGMPYTFNASVEDNDNVEEVHVYYQTDVTTPTNATMTLDSGTNYTNTITIPAGATELYYNISANDTADNWNETGQEFVPASDTIPPSITDNTPSTGDPDTSFIFNASVEDEVGVDEVNVYYWTDVSSPTNATMTLDSGTNYTNTTTIPVGATELYYNISANDTSNNWNDTGKKFVSTADTTPPSITDNTPGSGVADTDITFNASVSDNRDVGKVNVYYWTDVTDPTNETMILDSGKNYTNTITIPAEATELYYNISANDTSNNWAETGQEEIDITEIVPPTITDNSPDTAMTGEDYTFDASVTDNVDTGSDITVKVNYSTDVTSYQATSMSLESGTNYTETISIPDDATTLEYNITAEDTSENRAETGWNDVPVEDNNPPTISDNSAGTAAVEDDYTFNVSVTDNFDVAQVEVDYWYGTDTATGEDGASMTNVAGEYWTYEISLPLSTDPLHYNISAQDSSDNSAYTGEEQVTIIDDEAPVAQAGSDIEILEGENADFDGSSSDDNMGIMDYTWTFMEDGTEVSLSGVSPSYQFNSSGNYTVTLTVKDDAGNEDTDAVNVSVTADTDRDGTPDDEDPDADGDGMNDTWEEENNVSDPDADPDDDGLNNSEESEAGTDPHTADTDGDGIVDGEDENPLDEKEEEGTFDFPWWIIALIAAIIIGIVLALLFMKRGEESEEVQEDEEFAPNEEEQIDEEPMEEPGEEEVSEEETF